MTKRIPLGASKMKIVNKRLLKRPSRRMHRKQNRQRVDTDTRRIYMGGEWRRFCHMTTHLGRNIDG
jgi:hypothetical protein